MLNKYQSIDPSTFIYKVLNFSQRRPCAKSLHNHRENQLILQSSTKHSEKEKLPSGKKPGADRQLVNWPTGQQCLLTSWGENENQKKIRKIKIIEIKTEEDIDI